MKGRLVGISNQLRPIYLRCALGQGGRTFARGARQFVVQLALDTMLTSDVYLSSLTPTTNIGASLLGAEMTTFFAPPCTHHHNTPHYYQISLLEINKKLQKLSAKTSLQAPQHKNSESLITLICAEAFSLSVKTPVDSTTNSAPCLPQGISAGSLNCTINSQFFKKPDPKCLLVSKKQSWTWQVPNGYVFRQYSKHHVRWTKLCTML